MKTFKIKGLGKWFGCFWFFFHSLKWFLVVSLKDNFTWHGDCTFPLCFEGKQSTLFKVLRAFNVNHLIIGLELWTLLMFCPILFLFCNVNSYCWSSIDKCLVKLNEIPFNFVAWIVLKTLFLVLKILISWSQETHYLGDCRHL